MQLIRNFIVLANPISGTKAKDIMLQYIITTIQSHKHTVAKYSTDANGEYEWLLQKIEKENITDVIIVGGDGTINSVMNTIRDAKVKIGIIPAGSGNGLALAAGISKDYKKALQVILNGKTQHIDAFLCNNKFACMLCGIGFDAQVAHDFSQQKKRGLITYTKQSIKNFITAKPYLFQIEMDGISVSTEAYFISIANSNQFGNNFTIAPHASLSDGLLDIVIVQKMSKLKLPLAILQQLRGKNKYTKLSDSLALNNIVYLQAAAITIVNKQKSPLHIDGEAVDTYKKLEFNILKKCFQLYVP